MLVTNICSFSYNLFNMLLFQGLKMSGVCGKELKIISFQTYILLISAKLAKDVLLAPARSTCGGFMTIRFFSPVIISGFFSRIMSNTRVNNCKKKSIL